MNDIDLEELNGVGKATADKMRENNLTVEKIATMKPQNLVSFGYSGITEAKAQIIIDSAISLLENDQTDDDSPDETIEDIVEIDDNLPPMSARVRRIYESQQQ
jgi:predicted site-specific integrase-resolvase